VSATSRAQLPLGSRFLAQARMRRASSGGRRAELPLKDANTILELQHVARRGVPAHNVVFSTASSCQPSLRAVSQVAPSRSAPVPPATATKTIGGRKRSTCSELARTPATRLPRRHRRWRPARAPGHPEYWKFSRVVVPRHQHHALPLGRVGPAQNGVDVGDRRGPGMRSPRLGKAVAVDFKAAAALLGDLFELGPDPVRGGVDPPGPRAGGLPCWKVCCECQTPPRC